MREKMCTIRLYGRLGAAFGREYRMVVANPAEAVRALCSQLPGLKKYLLSAKRSGMAFAVFADRKNLSESELHDPVGNAVIRIAPVVIGSKRGGILSVIVGAALVAVGVVGMSAGWGAPFLNAGIAMTVGGVVQMLAPSPRGLNNKERPENTPSYAFAGPVNTQAQGNPVPVCYGRLVVGSAVVSAGIYAQDRA